MMKKRTLKVMRQLEDDFGPYAHPKLVIHGLLKPRGGMEYVGATETSYVSLGHELLHMWFAKGVMPANGNSGWMDEAIASWFDNDYFGSALPFYQYANLGNHSPYTRKTDTRSYKYGRSFLAYLDTKMKFYGLEGLKSFLRHFYQRHIFKNVTTDDFINDLHQWSGISFFSDFNQYVFGYTMTDSDPELDHHHNQSEIENFHHPHESERQLRKSL
jgi:hypothetical protein